MHKRVKWKVAQRWRKVRQALYRARWAGQYACWCGCDSEWVDSFWDNYFEAKKAVQ